MPPVRAEPGGELGVDGRRKGEARGLPKDSGDGLKVGLLDCMIDQIIGCLIFSLTSWDLTMIAQVEWCSLRSISLEC